jgi:ribose transport system substrate-binding protein
MKCHSAWFAAVITGTAWFAGAHAHAETIGVFTKSAGNPIARAVRAGAEAAAKTHGVTVFHYIPTSPDNVPQQTALVEEALSAKRDAIIFTPVDVKAMVPSVQKINAASIPLVNVSDRLTGGSAVAFVGTDDYAIALETARALLKAMGGKGNVVVLEGPATIPTAAARLGGFKDALKEFPEVKVLFSKNAMYARPAASDLLKATLKLNPSPQIDGVLAANDAMAVGAIEALDGANRKAQVIGINGTKEAIDAIKSGKLLASGDYNGFAQGCLGTMMAIRSLRDQPVITEIVLKPTVITKDNYGPFDIPLEQRTCPSWEEAGKLGGK